MIFFDPNVNNPSENVNEWYQHLINNKGMNKDNIEKIVKVSINKAETEIKNVDGMSGDVFYVNGLKDGKLAQLNVIIILLIIFII
jgi:hypothetical protein